jgi:hypothetical protein
MADWIRDAANDIESMREAGDHRGVEDATRAAENLIDSEVRNEKGAKPTKTNGLGKKR